MLKMLLCEFVGFGRDHERGKPEAQRGRTGWTRPGGHVGDKRGGVIERLAVDKPHVAVIGDERTRRLRLAPHINAGPRAKRIGGPQYVIVDMKVLSMKTRALATQ